MEKYLVLSLALFAWEVYAQSTDTIITVEVSAGDEIQSTSALFSSLPEVSSMLSESETEIASTSESAVASEETATESEQSSPTQRSSDEAMIQENESTESNIEVENAVSEDTIQQGLESEEGVAPTQQSLTEDTKPQTVVLNDTTSQPVKQQDTTSRSLMRVETTPQPAALEETTSTSVIQEETTLQPATQEVTTPQREAQEETTFRPIVQVDTAPTTQAINIVPEITIEKEETETERTQKEESADPESSLGQETNTTEGKILSTESPTVISVAERSNPTESSGDENTIAVRSTITVVIETEDTTTEASTEGVANAEELNGDPGGIAKVETACPTECTASTGDPICGSDQRVYENECHLKKDTCKKNVTVALWELCRGKHDICPAQCLNIQDPVCGEDGKIYPNLCLMFKLNCGKKMKTFDLVRCVNSYRGFRRVDGACPKTCHELYRPVCGSDRKVYSNDCYLRLQTCGRNVRVVEMSHCVDTPRCPHTCTPLYDPVCGSDGRMYLNHCYFANLNCGKSVAKVDLRYCESFQHLK